jgi:antitoxin component YwqK of YwqJK toxin-antitoxin module
MNMKIISFLIILLTIGNTFAQDINQVDEKGRKQGKWVVLQEKSRVPKYEGQFKDGEPYGKFTYYYPSRKVKSVIQFEDGTNISRALLYDENGALMAYGRYVNKDKDSTWTYYNPSKYVSFKENYVNGILHGPKIIYYIPETPGIRQQQAAQLFHYVDGILQGEVREFFMNGTIKMEGFYESEIYEGEVKRYHPNGKVMLIERYKDKMKHGWWISYDMNGKETNRRYFWNGKELVKEQLEKKLAELKAAGKNPNER